MAVVPCSNRFDALSVVSEEVDEIDSEEPVCDEEPVCESVARAKLHPETLNDLEREWQAVYLKFGSYFGEDREQSDYFSMLPLQPAQRQAVLDSARRYELEKTKTGLDK